MGEPREHDWERHPLTFALRCRECLKAWAPDRLKPKTKCPGKPRARVEKK